MGRRNNVSRMKGRKKALSKVKKSTIHHAKMIKQGKIKKRKITPYEKKKTLKKQGKDDKSKSEAEITNTENTEVEEDIDVDDMLGMIDEDHLKSLLSRKKSKLKRKVDNQIEEDYESLVSNKLRDTKEGNMKLLLPIKSQKGIIKRVIEMKENEDDSIEKMKAPEPDKEPLPPKSTVQLYADRIKKIDEIKIDIGASCSSILENPPEKLVSLGHIVRYLDIKDDSIALTVKKIAALSLLELFNDILPSYKIANLDTKHKMKKETRKLQHFESTLLSLYKSYLVKMEKWVSVLRKKDFRSVTPVQYNLGILGLKCLTQMLLKQSEFNFAPNIVNCIVPFMNHGDNKVSSIPCEALKQLFKSDKVGGITLKCVRRISQMVKAKNDKVKPKVIEVFMSLNLMNIDLDKEKEEYLKQKKSLNHKEKLMKLSKRERKRMKLREELERDLMTMEADKVKSKKSEVHTQIIQAVFTIYFRILKTSPKSKLIGTVLAGLSKFAHLINVDFFQDLITVLHEIISTGHLTTQQQLHCVNVVFTILAGQGEALLIDPFRFYVQCYSSLYSLAQGDSSEDIAMLLKSLHEMLVQRRKKISLSRVFAYAKRLATISLTMDHSGSLGILLFLRILFNTFKKLDLLLDLETPLSGVYDPWLENPDYCGANSSRLWELSMLKYSYHPEVRKVATFLSTFNPTSTPDNALPLELIRNGPHTITEMYSFKDKMRFIPAIPIPEVAKAKVAKHKDSNYLIDKELEKLALNLLSEDIPTNIDFHNMVIQR